VHSFSRVRDRGFPLVSVLIENPRLEGLRWNESPISSLVRVEGETDTGIVTPERLTA
jgi:hypothetical protein